MSVDTPKMAVAFGQYGIPQADVIECRVHLGCTKEVSSFELLLQNWDGKYSPNGSIPLAVGMDGSISIGRGFNVPQIITCRIESLKYESAPVEHYLRVSGRCWGERLFRRVFTGTFENMKGEDIVKHLLDYYVGLSHTRDSTELVENTSTLYVKLEYENTPVFDILRYIADSADYYGTIGYDFRVAPDGKFEFFRRNSKTSSVSLSEAIEEYEYRKDISRIRNKIYVYGAAEKKLPSDSNEDGWTESTSGWTSNGTVATDSNHVSEDGQKKYTDSLCVYAYGGSADSEIKLYRNLPSGTKFNRPGNFKQVNVWINWTRYGSGSPTAAKCILWQSANDHFDLDIKPLLPPQASWGKLVLRTDQPTWEKVGSADWNNPVGGIEFHIWHPEGCTPVLRLDHLHFSDCRYSAMQEDANSQSAYGLRELSVTDEELKSDNECQLRAKALLDYYKNPTEHLTIRSTVLDYGTTPILPGDRIYAELSNEGVSGYFRIESVEYHVDAKTQTLEITLELGRESPLLADYLYALRSKIDHLSRYKAGVARV
ncbi:MAG: hypothetical protein QXG76_05595 [Candidatus Bathyarchaeia archaeon]